MRIKRVHRGLELEGPAALVIDAGGTALKIGAVSIYQEINALGITRIPSVGILSKDIVSELELEIRGFAERNEISLEKFVSIGVSITGRFDGRGRYAGYLLERGVPADLEEQLGDKLGKRVQLMNDGVAWGIGARVFQTRGLGNIKDSFGVICLGTGAGFAVGEPCGRVSGMELSSDRFDWSELFRHAGYGKPGENWKVHDNLGRRYFSYVTSQGWTRKEIMDDYSRRLSLLMKAVQQQNPQIVDWFVGGGSARFVDVRQVEGSVKGSVTVFSEASLSFDPDWIPLIGAFYGK